MSSNPQYIIHASFERNLTGKAYRILQLAGGNEAATMPIYHPVRRNRATGPLTIEDARSAIEALVARDEQTGAIRRGQSAQAGLGPVPEQADKD